MRNYAFFTLGLLALLASLAGCSKPYQQREIEALALDGDRLFLYMSERSGSQTEVPIGPCPKANYEMKRQRLVRIAFSLVAGVSEPEVRLLSDESSNKTLTPTLGIEDLPLPPANSRFERPAFITNDDLPLQTK